MNEREKKGSLGKHFIDRQTGPQVTGFIGKDNKPLWEEYKKRCRENRISITYEGFSDMLRTYNRLNRIAFPLAEKLKLLPLEFRDTILDNIVEVIEELNIDIDRCENDIEEIQDFAKKQIKNKTDECLTKSIKSAKNI